MKILLSTLFFIASLTGFFSYSKAETVSHSFPTKFNSSSVCIGNHSKNWNSCVGEVRLADGTGYVGDFVNGNVHGIGYMIASNGTKVLGNFSNNKITGLALLVKSDGDRFAGYFKEDKLHGQGIYKKNDGELVPGKWKKDEFKEKVELANEDLLKILEIDLEVHLERFKSNLNKSSASFIESTEETKKSPNRQTSPSKLPKLTLFVPEYDSRLKTIKDINNNIVLQDPSRLSGENIGVCLLVDEKEFSAEGINYLKDGLTAVIVDYFNELAPNNKPIKVTFKGSQYLDLALNEGKEFVYATDCWDWQHNQLKLSAGDFILMRDKDEKYLANNEVIPGLMPDPNGQRFFSISSSSVMDNKLFSGYKPLFKINNQALLAKKNSIEIAKKQEKKESSDRGSQFKAYAQKNSKEVVSSISFDIEDERLMSWELSLCTTGYEGAEKMAIDGYALLDFQPYSESYKNKIAKISSNPKVEKKIHSFKDVNELYMNYQLPNELYNKKIRCNVYVDYPSNVNKLLEAIQLNKPAAKLELNALYNSEQLRDKFISTNTSFKSFKDYQFASTIGATDSDLEILKQNGVGDMSGFNGLVSEMQGATYANTQKASDVISYLKDKKEGGSIQGAIKVRGARQALQAKMMKEALARQRKLDAMRSNKVFKQGIICVGDQSIAYGQMQVIVDLYGNGTNIRSITDFILRSNGCFLKDVIRKGNQLKEVRRNGNFVMVQDSSYISPYTGFGMIHANDWDNP